MTDMVVSCSHPAVPCMLPGPTCRSQAIGVATVLHLSGWRHSLHSRLPGCHTTYLFLWQKGMHGLLLYPNDLRQCSWRQYQRLVTDQCAQSSWWAALYWDIQHFSLLNPVNCLRMGSTVACKSWMAGLCHCFPNSNSPCNVLVWYLWRHAYWQCSYWLWQSSLYTKGQLWVGLQEKFSIPTIGVCWNSYHRDDWHFASRVGQQDLPEDGWQHSKSIDHNWKRTWRGVGGCTGPWGTWQTELPQVHDQHFSQQGRRCTCCWVWAVFRCIWLWMSWSTYYSSQIWWTYFLQNHQTTWQCQCEQWVALLPLPVCNPISSWWHIDHWPVRVRLWTPDLSLWWYW